VTGCGVRLLVMAVMLAGCATSSPAPLQISRSIAVMPANNLTGDPLLVQGAGLIDRYVRHASEVSVADVLQSEARYQLQQKGFDVREWKPGETSERIPASLDGALALARQNGIRTNILYLEIRQWQADGGTQTRFIIAAVTASLVDPVSGREIWHEQRKAAPVGTPGTITVEAAYVAAARKIMAEILAPLKPEPPPK
jgi:hypothetical protein